MSVKNESKRDLHLFESWAFTRRNYLLFLAGVVLIVLGYVIMAAGTVNSFQSLTLAPILLFLGYVVVIPAALIYRDRRPGNNSRKA